MSAADLPGELTHVFRALTIRALQRRGVGKLVNACESQG